MRMTDTQTERCLEESCAVGKSDAERPKGEPEQSGLEE